MDGTASRGKYDYVRTGPTREPHRRRQEDTVLLIGRVQLLPTVYGIADVSLQCQHNNIRSFDMAIISRGIGARWLMSLARLVTTGAHRATSGRWEASSIGRDKLLQQACPLFFSNCHRRRPRCMCVVGEDGAARREATGGPELEAIIHGVCTFCVFLQNNDRRVEQVPECCQSKSRV